MHDFNCVSADEMYYDELAERVRFHKQQEQGVKTVCRIVEEYCNEKAEEARKEATAKRNLEIAEKLLCEGCFSLEKISNLADVPLEQVRQMAEKLAEPVCG